MGKRVRDVGQKGRLDAAILEFVILRGSLLSCCKVLVHARCHVQRMYICYGFMRYACVIVSLF